jgi:predicted N-acetyltransferase YhbS
MGIFGICWSLTRIISNASEYEVPDEVFMFLELEQDSPDGANGIIKYNAIFSSL